MSSLPSDEVAEDYKVSLEDLMTNDRYQISNLTLIAKENVEHAEAISRVLQNHINRAPPSRKLPALYVLDSIAKNVGSPYTVYFGRNLHQIFMHAYSQVDGPIRRKLEEMLKTWREPVPGSTSPTTVFPNASTQSIVDSLNKFRSPVPPTNRYQSAPGPGHPARVVSAHPYRQTPTPPQSLPPFPPNPPSHIRSPQPRAAMPQQPYLQGPPVSYGQPYPTQSVPQYQQSQPLQPTHTLQYPSAPPQPLLMSLGAVDIQKLHLDIDDLTTDAKIECATHPMDAGAQRKLASLQTLKEILDSGSASENDLVDIRNTIMQKMAEKMTAIHQPPAQASVPSTPLHNTYIPPQPPIQHPPAPTTAPHTMFNSTNLAELLRATANQQQGTHPPNYYTQLSSGVNTPMIAPTAPASENPLLAQLRASGFLSATSTPPQGVTPPLPPFATFTTDANMEVSFTSAAIKIPRPHLISTFLNARPNQCSTCGRRFTSDDVGREKKARHLDWHFKTKARMLEAEKRGQNRSWYVDEREWIASKEYEDDFGPADANGASSNAKKKAEDFVRVPADSVLRSLPCPIDQEPFKSEWSEEVQDFIWKDAVYVGGRYYHASCYAEVTKGREKDGITTPISAIGRTATPDSVLGKRKAEVR
ncbi:uncharacterized protein Z518_11256 [Rhinocladiella mackenziei CBS 650.93]|uniref:CID domain-containing protein n=1 Tax=Rhinocladiella mackenziei CBS 650.93 TaxID=1442369 RepID=A0A0D2GME6_9EURO|nr:uncharacterized protein Z518_11256 [Rhinocladiella mackenziei CBS 650.93]KIW99517.1 hypothetical protein Z518_11256 [Rhinocladiella mackenziei CBS 650.93]